jgi:hypothetical protein
MHEYIVELTASWSQALNAFLGGNRDQTFSSRSYEGFLLRKRLCLISKPCIDFLFGDGHCEKAFSTDNERTYD